MSYERWAARSALQELQAETLNASETARYARNSAYVRLFLICICFAEIVILVPNILTEVAIDRGLYAPILRTVLSVVRLSPLMWPLLGKMGRWGAALRHLVEVALPTIYGPACGGVEPCRGFATALSGWYLISTPMHDAFSPTTEADLAPKELQPPGQNPPFDEDLLLPCAVIMSANVGLFLCDALSLTVTPLLRNSDNLAVQLAYPRAEVFHVTSPEDLASAKFEPTCVICIAEFEPGETLSRLPCGHAFHRECVGEWLHQHAKCPLRCPGLVLPPLQERSDSRDSWVQEMGGDVFRADGFGSLDPWLIGAPLYDTPVQLFRERLDPMPLPSAVLEEESDSEEETPPRRDEST
ncbi:RNF43 [Symbiodinium sp. CCMP2456]|nr:RNF43 [Symbiodinium sp. CCMP2456]